MKYSNYQLPQIAVVFAVYGFPVHAVPLSHSTSWYMALLLLQENPRKPSAQQRHTQAFCSTSSRWAKAYLVMPLQGIHRILPPPPKKSPKTLRLAALSLASCSSSRLRASTICARPSWAAPPTAQPSAAASKTDNRRKWRITRPKVPSSRTCQGPSAVPLEPLFALFPKMATAGLLDA